MIAETLQTLPMLAAVVLAFAGGAIRGYTGFGTPIFLAPIYAVLFGPQAAVPLLIILEIGIAVQMAPSALRQVDWPELRGLLLGCLPMLPVGGLMLSILDPNLVKKIIGLVTATFVAALWWGWRYGGPRTLPVRMAIGAVSGFSNGLTGIGGPPIILYYLSGEKEIAGVRANLVIYFAFITLIAVPFFLYAGLMTLDTVLRWAALTPPLLVGVAVGSRFFQGTSRKDFMRAALLTLLVSALVGIFG
jgi:uncharacterized membrane protein YfcA